MYAKCDKINHVLQDLLTFSLTGSTRTDGQKESHIDYSADLSVQEKKFYPRVKSQISVFDVQEYRNIS